MMIKNSTKPILAWEISLLESNLERVKIFQRLASTFPIIGEPLAHKKIGDILRCR